MRRNWLRSLTDPASRTQNDMLTPQQQAAVPLMASAAVASEAATRLPADFQMAQCIFESAWLTRAPGQNCFGLKPNGHGSGIQHFVSHEVVNGTWRQIPEAFETYDSLAACFADHARLITEGAPYAHAWLQFQIDGDVDGLVRRVCPIYGTDPDYTSKILSEMHGPTVTVAIAAARGAAT